MTIAIQHLTKIFPGQLRPALEDITVGMPKGQITGLVGPDGAGKTTLIRLIAALLTPTRGTITIEGHDTIQEAETIHFLTGYMPQRFGLYEDLTVMQNLTLYADLRGVLGKEREERFEKLLKFTGLAPFINRFAKALSGGMKQKLGLACALVKKPTLLLLDEPSVGVDPISRRELWKMVEDLVGEGVSILWSTAYLDEAHRCSSVLLLSDGKLLFNGNPRGLTEDAFIDILGRKPEEKSELAARAPFIKTDLENVVVADALTKKFGDFIAVDQVSFKVKKGEIFGLLGPNGAGKTTVFKMVCGLLRPTEGKASVNGVDLQDAPSIARSHIGYMAQKFSLYGNLSVRQNLEFFSGIYNLGGKVKQRAIEEMIEIFDLKQYLNMTSEILPLGFKQRLALACANMHHPAILFLDEPTSGVDPITRREFWNHINGLVGKGVTVMVTTHFMDEAEYCTRLALVYGGKIIDLDTPDGLKNKSKTATLEDAFIHMIEEYEPIPKL